MGILHYSTSAFALFTSPPVYLLPAPPQRLALPSPKIAGLLPARTPTRRKVTPEPAQTLENLVLNCPNFDDLLAAIGPIRPAAELEAEFAAIQARIEANVKQLYTQLTARSARASMWRGWFATWQEAE